MYTRRVQSFFLNGGEAVPVKNIQVCFTDGIPRTAIELKSLLKGSQWEKVINMLSGYRLLENTLLEVQQAIESLLTFPDDEKPTIISTALWAFIVIQYGKCYKKNPGWTVMLQASATIEKESTNLKNGHKWVIEQRDTFVAHGGKTPIQKSLVMVARQDESPNQIDSLHVNSATASLPTRNTLINLNHLAEAAILYVREDIAKIERKIFLSLFDEGHVIHPDLVATLNLKNVKGINE